MRKEVFIVIIIGIVIGAIIAYGIYTAQTAINTQKDQTQTKQEEQTVEPTPEPTTHTLSIIEPKNESISENEEITLAGTSSPGAVVTIITQENDYLLTADENGNFSAEIILSGGANEIIVSAFNQSGNKAEQILTIVYSTAEL